MPEFYKEKILLRSIIIAVFALFILAAVNTVPVWAEQTSDSAASVCSTASSSSNSDSSSSSSDSCSDSSASESGDADNAGGSSDRSSTGSSDCTSSSSSNTFTDASDGSESGSSADISSESSSTDSAAGTESSQNIDTANNSDSTNTPSESADSNNEPTTVSENLNSQESEEADPADSGNNDSDTTTNPSESPDSNNDPTTESDSATIEENEATDPSDSGSNDSDTTINPSESTDSNNDPATESGGSVNEGNGEAGENQNNTPDQPLAEDMTLETEQETEEIASIPQGMECDGDPWGYLLDAVTEAAVSDATVEIWQVTGEGTLVTKDNIINEANPVSTNADGLYSFTVKTSNKYQLKITKTGYVDFMSQIYDFAHDAVTHVEDLYLVPLVTDASGQDITLKHDLVTNGQSITVIADKLTVDDNIIVDTRQTDETGVSTGNSGSVTLTGKESLTINTGASIRADVSAGSTYTPGTITLTAVNNTVSGLDLSNLTVPLAPTTANITVKGRVSGGDVVIRASAGLEETPQVVDIDDYSTSDWCIAKLKEYMEMIPLPVVVKMRDNQATVTIDSGAVITGSQKINIDAEANAEAKAQGTFSKEFIGYCKAKGWAEVNVNNGAVITADDNVLIRSQAKTTADLNVTVDNSKNNNGFSLALAVTDTDLTSHATVAQGANITGKNVNIQAWGRNLNHATTKSTHYTDGSFMAMLSLNFTESDVKSQVNGTITASGEEIALPADLNDRLTGGIGVLARLDSDDSAKTIVGIGGSATDAREKNIDETKTKSAKDMIIGFFQKNYKNKAEDAETDQKHDSGTNKNLQAAAACSCSKVNNGVIAEVGSTADLKSGLDLMVKSQLVETARTQTHSSAQGDTDGDGSTTSNAISAAVSIGLYDNSATTEFAGQSDAKRDTVISSLVSYPFLLDPRVDVSPGTFKNGLNLEPSLIEWNFAKDVLGLLEEMINSWTISTATGETAGVAGAVTYLEYNNTAAATIKNTARINQRTDASYRSNDQTVAVDAAADLNQIIVVGNFDFRLSQNDLNQIFEDRGNAEPYHTSVLTDPQGVTSGKAGIGGSILLSYITDNVTAHVENGARIHAGSHGQIDVTASNKVTHMEFVQSGGQAGKFGVAGSFSLDNENATVLAQIHRGTVLDAGALNIKASDASSHLNIVGGVIRADGIGIGASVAINELTRNIEAGIIQPTGSTQGNTSNIEITGPMNVEAAALGDILAATVAASLPAKSEDQAPDQSKDTSSTTSGAPQSGSTGTGKSQGKFGIGVSGAVSINEVNDTVKAYVNYADKLGTGSLTINASNETNLLALTGSAAYTKSSQETSGTLAGAYSQVTLNGTTEASIIGTELAANALSLLAERVGNLWAISAGGANSPGKSGIAVAGSVSINNITNNTQALVDSMKGSVSGPTLVHAKDRSSMHVIAGAEGYGGRGGFGAAVAYNDLQNDTKARIIHSNWTQQATLELLAENSIRAGPIDETFDISGNPADNVEILAIAASLGVSPKGNFGGAGTVAINRIGNTVEASMADSICTVTGAGQVSFTGRDDSNIFSITGAMGGAKNVGIGAAVAYNEISNKAYTFIDGSTLNNAAALSLTTESGGFIKTLSLGAAGAQDVALGGSVSVNTINNQASSYIKSSTVSAINNISISSTGSAGIGSVAGGFAGAGKAAVGAAMAINNIGTAADPHQIKAYIEGSRVTTTNGSLSLASTSNCVIKSITAGGAGADKCAIGGSVSVNNIVNDIEASIKDCNQGEEEVKALNNITLDAVDNSVVSVIAGSVAGAGTAAMAGSAATVSVGYCNPVDHTVTYSKTRAYIQNSRVTSTNGAVALEASSNSVIFNVAAGAGVAGTFGGQGSVCLNWIYNDIAARITDSTVTAKGDITVAASTVKRNKMPKGAIQPHSDNTEITTFDGNPDDLDADEDGQPTTHALSSLQALAGSVAGGGTAGVGLVVATNEIANLVSAGITGSTITSHQGNVRVTASSAASIEAVSAALAAAGEFAGAGSVSLNKIKQQISSFIINSQVAAHNTSNEMVEGQLPGVNVKASDTSVIRSISGGVGIGGSAGLGGAAAYNEIGNTVKAYVEGCKPQGTDKWISSSGSLTVNGKSSATIETISAGGAFGGYFGAAGSVTINTMGNTVEAYIKDSVVDVDDHVYVLAESDNTIHGYGGALAGGLVGISGAVVVNTVENTTKAYILHSSVMASGTGSAIPVKTWNANGEESTEDLKGLFVIADCSDTVEMYSGAAAGGAGAAAGQTSVNLIKDITQAFIGASDINSAADFGQWVKVKAHQGTQVDIWAGGLCVSGAGVGAAVDRTLIENTTQAFISDSDASGTDPSPVDSVVYARGVEVSSRTRENVNSKLAGMAFSGTASGAGAVSAIDFDSDSLAAIARSKVFVQGPIKVYASDFSLLDSKVATFAASAGGSIAGSVVVNTLSNTAKASVQGADLNATKGIEVQALGSDKISIMSGGVGLGQGGIGGVVSFNTMQNTTEASLTKSGSRFTLLNQDTRFKPGGIYAPDANQTVLIKAENTSTVDNTGLAGGAGIYIGRGAAVDVTKVQNRTAAYVGAGTKIYSRGDVNIEAQATKIIDSKTAAVGIGLVGISGAISITSLGEAISSEGASQFTGELRQQVNSDASVKNLPISDNDTTAQTAGNKVNALTAPDLNSILSATQDTSGIVTAAYIEDGTSAGAKAEIISDADVTIKAANNYTITGTRGQVAAGAIAAGASITIINTYERTQALVGSYSIIRAQNLSVLADSTETAKAESYAAQAGLYAGGGNIAHVKLNPLVEASLGSCSNISVANQAAITAGIKPQAKASVYGVTVAYGAKVAVADAKAECTPTVNASIGQHAKVTCGYQPLGGNPILSFFSGSELTGNPTLTFTVKSVQMSGNPTLHFAAGNAGGYDTVSRNDSGTWSDDGFEVGDYISISGTDKNNAVYQIKGISADGKTLTLDTQGVVQAEDKTGANVYIERAGEITRSSGSWIEDDFVEGEFILVSGTGSNDGYYEIGRIIDDSTLELDVSDEISSQTASSAAVIGDTADMIRRSEGSWLDDGFEVGQYIKVSGSQYNDGQYRIKSISSDGKILTLDSLTLFSKEQGSGINVTIVDYSDSESNTAGLKVHASESLPAEGSTAEAYAFGAGGALLSVDCTMATAKNTSTVAAWVANNANVTVAGTVEIKADTATKQTAGADGYNGGAVQAGNNKAAALSTGTGGQLNITTAGLEDNVNISAFQLLISSYRTDNNYAEAFAGSGGAFNLVLIEAATANHAATRAALGSGVKLDVDRLQIIADHTATFNSKADSISLAGIGLGAGRANNDISSTVEANIGPSSTILARDMTVYANNRTKKDWLPNSNYNVRSRSGGVLDFQAAESKTQIINTTQINVGDNSSIQIPGSMYNLGRLDLEILNSVLARDKVNIDIGGAITGAKAVSQITNTNTGIVNIGKNVNIVSVGDVNLSARTYSNIQTYAAAKCYGAAGLADANSKAVSTSTNKVDIGQGAKITSYGQINLLAGRSSEGYPNTCYSLASADVNNYTAVPLKTSPEASGIINLNNYLNIAPNAVLRAVKDANLLTEEGIRITDGTGTAKNLYSEFLGMDCREIDTDINVNSRAVVDGSLEVGIQNQQILIIEADGTVSTQTDGVVFIRTKYEMHAKILEELELARRMRDEYAGTAAAHSFEDEIIRLQGELIQLGHQVYTQNGQTLIEQSVWADYIIVGDVWAQSSNINILAGSLSGQGTLRARGDAKIEIINKSPAYLRVNSLTIPENSGGKIMLNRAALDSGQLNGVTIISGTSSGEPQINVRSTYTGGNNPDVELYGNVENRNGPLYVSSTGGITSKGDIRAGRVALNATGDFIQSYVDTFYPVGGEPRLLWQPVTSINEALKGLYVIYPDMDDDAIAQVLNTEPQGKIEAANIVISARYLNINGAIISGHPEQRLVLGSDLNSKIADFWKKPRWNYHDNLITENGGIKAYFDLITQRVIVEGVSAEGGYVSLFGQIMNTGGGRIEALDGFATIHIENHTHYDLQVGALDTGRGSEGMVVIKDTAPMTWLPGTYSETVTRVYTRLGNQIQIWDNVDPEDRNLLAYYDADQDIFYQPLAGLRYSWVTAQSKLTQTSTTYRKSTWLGVDWLAKDPGNIYKQSTILLDAEPLLEGEYIEYRPDLVGSAYTYRYKSEMVTQYDGDGNAIVDGNGNPVSVLIQQDSWVKKKWWGKKTYYLKQVYQKATKDVNYHSIKADYGIPILFKGGTDGTVDITSDHGLFMTGCIINPNGTTHVSARGSVEQTENMYIQSQEITVIGDGGIGSHAILSIDLRGGSLIARALQGVINIQAVNGPLKLHEVTNTNGDVHLASKGDIIGANPDSSVTGKRVSLNSENGGIGTVHSPLLINSGTESGQGIKAQANNSIYLKKAAGNLHLITISSTAGDVYVEAADGSIVDGNTQFSRDTITEGFVLGTWRNLGLSGQLTASQLRYLLGVTLKVDRKPDIWQEYDPTLGIDVNVRGNNVTLKALHGAIGHTTGTLTLNLSDLAALDLDSKLALIAADPKDIRYYDAAGNLIAADDTGTLAVSAVISVPDEVDIEAGTINAEAGSDIFLGALGEVAMGTIKGGQVRIRSDQGMTNGLSDGSVNISSDDLILTAENGAVGAPNKALVLAVKDGSILRALARDGIYLDQQAAGVGRSGNVYLDYIHTEGDVSLQAAQSIVRTNAGTVFDILCEQIKLAAMAGSIGSSTDGLRIEQMDGRSLKAAAGTDIFLEELTGNMLIDLVDAGGDVRLRAPGSIRAASADGHTAVIGNNINLTAVDGRVGEEDTFLRIDSSATGPGRVDIAARGNIYVQEAAGNLNLGIIRSLSKGRVYLASAGGITNGLAAGVNVDADRLKMIAASGVGASGNPIYTLINKVEGSGGAGGFYLDNGGVLTVGGVDTINGVQADGTIRITANSPLTVAEDIVAGGDIELTAGDTVDPDDDLIINENCMVQAGGSIDLTAGDRLLIHLRALVEAGDSIDAQAGSSVILSGSVLAGDSIDLRAADDILLDANSIVQAVNNVRMAGDYGNNDPGNGCKVEIYGILGGQYVEVMGEADDDEFIVNGAAIQGPVTLLGGSGNDQYTVTNLHTIDTWHDGKKDRITMDGQDGSDLYTVNLVGNRDYIVEALDSGATGNDILILNGTPNADRLLLREKFIAHLQGTEVERVNYDTGMERLDIYAFAGDDSFYLDDNSAITNIYGAEGDDFFQIGQMFGSARDANAGVAPGDEIATVLTTRGYLSRGISYETKICGADGNDSFMVYSNQAHLLLEGEDGNDLFTVRAFALADPDHPSQPRTTINGGNGDDHIEYNINAPVDIDGGIGNDTVRIIGSEFADVFVINENGIVGAGLNVSSGEVECYEAYGMEGDDVFYIQGTRAGMVTMIFGGYGSDSFYILGDVTRYVSTSGTYESMVEHDLDRIKGTLIIEGSVSNEGSDCVLLAGVTLPTETNPPLSDVPTVDESKMTDSLYVYNDDSAGGDSGTLTPGHLQGLGMGTGTTINQGTSEDPDYVEYPGGIIFSNLEVVEILLGAGEDTFEIDGTDLGTITAVHGGGGHDDIRATGYGGPLVIYGDTDSQGSRYSGVHGTASEHGHGFSNSDYDYLDASTYLAWAVIYGGPGDDYIMGTGWSDCLAGGPGNDWISGSHGDDLIYGDSGFNVDLRARTLSVRNPGTCGSDFLDGGYGEDIIFGDYGVPCYLSLRNTSLDTKRIEIRSLSINGGSDYILGGPGDDVLIGGMGSDTIDGQEGNDLIFGDNAVENLDYTALLMGAGTKQLLQVVEPAVVITFTHYAQGYMQTNHTDNSLTDLLRGLSLIMPWLPTEELDMNELKNVVVIRYKGTQQPVPQYLSIVYAEDSSAPWWAKLPLMLKAGSLGADDYLAGGPGNDAIYGQGGDDTIQGDSSLAEDWAWVRVYQGRIVDIYPSASAITDGNDYIEGGSGNDTLFGNGGNDDIVGGTSDLFAYNTDNLPGDGQDIIFGNSGRDLDNEEDLDPQDHDAILGGNGNIYRVLLGDQGSVLFLNPSAGSVTRRALEPLNYAPLRAYYKPAGVYRPTPGDIAHGEGGNDLIHGMDEDDFLYGETGNDHIMGGSGYDTIIGGSGENQIIQND